jgi:hypothetical protein
VSGRRGILRRRVLYFIYDAWYHFNSEGNHILYNISSDAMYEMIQRLVCVCMMLRLGSTMCRDCVEYMISR